MRSTESSGRHHLETVYAVVLHLRGKMRSVFILWHVHEFEDQDDDEKLIGVYASPEDADAAIQRLKTQPGFRDHPDGFQVDEYEIGKDHWTEGFTSWKEAMGEDTEPTD